MSGKITQRLWVELHACKGKPGLLRRLISNIGLGSHWTCDDCGQVWVLKFYEGWGWDWDRK